MKIEAKQRLQATQEPLKVVPHYDDDGRRKGWEVQEGDYVHDIWPTKRQASEYATKVNEHRSKQPVTADAYEDAAKKRAEQIQSIEKQILRIEMNPDNTDGGAKAFHSGYATKLKPSAQKKIDQLNTQLDKLMDEAEAADKERYGN